MRKERAHIEFGVYKKKKYEHTIEEYVRKIVVKMIKRINKKLAFLYES